MSIPMSSPQHAPYHIDHNTDPPYVPASPARSYFFLATLPLAIVGWGVGLVSQAIVTHQVGNATVGPLWFAIVLQTIIILGLVASLLVLPTVPFHSSQTHIQPQSTPQTTFPSVLSTFSSLSIIVIVFAVQGVHNNIFDPAIPAQRALSAGWLITAIVDVIWMLYFTAPPGVRLALDAAGSGSGSGPGAGHGRGASSKERVGMDGNVRPYSTGSSAPGNGGQYGGYQAPSQQQQPQPQYGYQYQPGQPQGYPDPQPQDQDQDHQIEPTQPPAGRFANIRTKVPSFRPTLPLALRRFGSRRAQNAPTDPTNPNVDLTSQNQNQNPSTGQVGSIPSVPTASDAFAYPPSGGSGGDPHTPSQSFQAASPPVSQYRDQGQGLEQQRVSQPGTVSDGTTQRVVSGEVQGVGAGVGAEGAGAGAGAGEGATGEGAVPPEAPGKDAGSKEKQYLWRAEALYNYDAQPTDPNELPFKRGDVLEICDKSGKWWEARRADGAVGIVPSNYLRLL